MINDNKDKNETIRDPRWETYWEFVRQSEKDEDNLDEYNKLTDNNCQQPSLK